MDLDPKIRVREASKMLKLDIKTVCGLIRSGVLRGEKLVDRKNSSYTIALSEILRFKEITVRDGRL